MWTTSNTKCFQYNGRYGFYATGNVPVFCSSGCSSSGKAEVWCQKCCSKAYTMTYPSTWSTSPFSVSTADSSPTSSGQPTLSPTVSSRAYSAPTGVIALASILGIIVLILMLALFYYCLRKKLKRRKTDSHLVEGGGVPPDQLPLSTQCQDDEGDRQQSSPAGDDFVHGQTEVVGNGERLVR